MRMLSPKKVVDGIHIRKNLKSDDVVIDLGAGSGSFTFELMKRIGRENKIVAVDIDKEILQKIKDSAIIGGYNIETILYDLENKLIFQNEFADYVFLTNVLHQIEQKDNLIKEIHRTLKPAGNLIVIDWHKHSAFGPKKEMRLESENLLENLNKYFIIKDELDAGKYHFGFLLEKK